MDEGVTIVGTGSAPSTGSSGVYQSEPAATVCEATEGSRQHEAWARRNVRAVDRTVQQRFHMSLLTHVRQDVDPPHYESNLFH